MGKRMRKFKQWWAGTGAGREKPNGAPDENEREQRIASRAGAAAFSYTHRGGSAGEGSAAKESPVLPLYSPEQVNDAVKELRGILARDATPECQQALAGEMGSQIRSFCKHWYQRIDYPK